jgi:2-C-methyl-D-erythritol 4-phosphate cytidylyltransferase
MSAAVKSDVCVMLLAGGAGKRFGLAVPKLLALVNGKPLLAHSISTALTVPFASQVIIACNASIRSEVERIMDACRRGIPESNEVHVVEGGGSRAESVGLALRHIKNRFVLIHDADRPVTTHALYQRVFEAIRPGVGVVPVTSPADSVIRENAEGTAAGYIPRAEVMLAQTPQGFVTAEYHMARDLLRGRLERYTDDGSAFLAGGYRIVLVPGERGNIKVTFPVDLHIAEVYMNELSEE